MEYWMDGILDGWNTGWMEYWMDGILDGWNTGWMEYWMGPLDWDPF
jgi:hypothetical protein